MVALRRPTRSITTKSSKRDRLNSVEQPQSLIKSQLTPRA